MNALQPVYQLVDRTILQDFINALLVESLIPASFIVDFKTAQSEFDVFGLDLKQHYKGALEQQYFVLLPEQNLQRLTIFEVKKGIAQPWSIVTDSEVLLVERSGDQSQVHSIELFELFEYLQATVVFQHCQTEKLEKFSAQIKQCLKQYSLLPQHQVQAHDLLDQSSARVFRILEQYAGYRETLSSLGET